MLSVYLGIFAGLLQALGYFLYVFMTLRRDLKPNASTWFMFAYGTALLTVLEWERDASAVLLIVPVVCSVLAIVVACICWRRGTLRWPDDKEDRVSFGADLVLTVCYVAAWLLYTQGMLTSAQVGYAILVFLVASNLTAFTSFTPLLREARTAPGHERYEPWLVWAFAYLVLGIATYLEEGFWTELMLYPLLNAPLHAAVAWLARPSRQKRLCLPA